jgi:hypothetical protein
METRGLATVSVVVAVTPAEDAVMVVVPGARAVARPAALMVATAPFDESQLEAQVRSLVVPSLKEAVALNCWVAFTLIDGAAGVIARAGAVFPPPPPELEPLPPHPTNRVTPIKRTTRKSFFIRTPAPWHKIAGNLQPNQFLARN